MSKANRERMEKAGWVVGDAAVASSRRSPPRRL